MTVSLGSGTSSPHIPKDNLTAASAPTVNDDISLEYSPGSRWIDLVADKLYVCLDSTFGAAVWSATTTQGSLTWLGLTDTPASFASQALKIVRVNAGETALEFATDSTLTGLTDGTTVSFGHTAGSITTGTTNTFVGLNAGDSITSGSGNTALGFDALTGNIAAHDNTAFGDSALKFSTAGQRNTAVGVDALGLTVAVGHDNVAVGKGAASSNSGGDGNVAIGTWALNQSSGVTNDGNIAIGFGTLRYVTTETGNTAIGYLSLGAVTNTGLENTSVGFNSMAANTTASGGTAIGWSALAGNLTGFRCTAIGHSALLLADGANDCTAVGHFSLDAVTSGQFNTAVGSSAGTALTSGEDNTLVGYKAGLALTTVGNNTIIGSDALPSGTGAGNTIIGKDGGLNLTTGASNVIIGLAAGPTGNVSNQLFIHNSTSDTPLIHGDFSAGTAEIYGKLKYNLTINAQTGTTYTLVLGDKLTRVTMDNASANTLTIPTNASVAFPAGTRILVAQLGAGATTITGDTGVTLNGVSAGSGTLTARYDEVYLTKEATDTWTVSGDIGAVA